ncbi:MAG: hypothetical protein ACQEP8_03785 [Chlamydiota bacterium]
MMNLRKNKKACPFTLLEIVFVAALLLVLGSVVGLNVTKALRKERFRASSELLVDKLQLAEDLMLNLKVNVYLDLQPRGEGFVAILRIDNKPYARELRAVIDRPFKLSGVERIEFTAADSRKLPEKPPLTLEFLSGGAKMADGNLYLQGEGMQRYLYISQHPGPILVGEQPLEEPYENVESEEVFPYEIYQ